MPRSAATSEMGRRTAALAISRSLRVMGPCLVHREPPCHSPFPMTDTRGQRTSNRSRSMTLAQAATKSCDELLAPRRRWRRPRPARAARSSSRTPGRPGCRSTDLVPWPRRVPRRSRRPRTCGVHVVPRSSRFTKKSLVSVPGPVGEHAERGPVVVGAEHAQAADQHGHLGRAEGEQVGLVDEQVLGRQPLALAEVVAEAVGDRLEGRERLDVGLLLRSRRCGPG